MNAKSRHQIAAEYGISYKTLMRMLKKKNIGLSPGLIFPNEQVRIYQALGFPNVEIKKQFERQYY